MKIREEIETQALIRAFALLDDKEALYVTDKEFYQIDIKTKASLLLLTLPEEVHSSKDIGISISCNKRFVAVYGVHASHGLVYDRQTSKTVLSLNRGKYHVHRYSFSIAFFEHEKRQLLVHATDWNELHITDLESGEQVTKREKISHKNITEENKRRFLDYFHSQLHISPGNQWIISNGLVWGPAAMLYTWNLQNWLLRNPYELEDNLHAYVDIGLYSWDRPLFWLNDHEFVYYYHTSDSHWGEEYEEQNLSWWLEGMEKSKGSLLVYNIPQRKNVRCILFDGFEVNEYWECDKTAKLFYLKGNIISSCPKRGVRIMAEATSTVLQVFPEIQLSDFHEPTATFISLKENKVTLYELDSRA